MPKTIVLGLDGANWELLNPWIDDGTLTNIADLVDDGVRTDMESCLPPVTCPNWRCYSTGKNPGKLGVFWWEKIDTDSQTLSTPNSRSFKSANFWDYLNDQGRSAGIMNIPMTYPPFDVDDFLIAGGPGSQEEDYAYPRDLQDELDERGYRLHPEVPVTTKDDTDEAADLVDLIDHRLRIFRDIIDDRDIDVAHLTIFYINVLQHFFWRGEPTKEGWKVIDEHIGAIREEYPDATLMLMSDHGCKNVDTVFNVNSWLEQQGYLRRDRNVGDLFLSLGINQRRILGIVEKLHIRDLVAKLTPERLKDSVPTDAQGFKREQKLEKVDWDQTQAIASGQGLIYVIDGDRDVAKSLIEELRSAESEISGKLVAKEALLRDEVYTGPYIDEAPLIVFDQTDGVLASGAIGDKPVFDTESHWEAENVRTGLFLAVGPDIETGTLPNPVSITDIAPTVLRSVECSVPRDMDGEPLSLFGNDEFTYCDPLIYEETAGTSDPEITDRLEDLGYLE